MQPNTKSREMSPNLNVALPLRLQYQVKMTSSMEILSDLINYINNSQKLKKTFPLTYNLNYVEASEVSLNHFIQFLTYVHIIASLNMNKSNESTFKLLTLILLIRG